MRRGWTALALSLALATSARADLAPESLLVYFGYPSGINGASTISGAAAQFGAYEHVVLGDGLQDPSHPDHANLVGILADPAVAGTRFYGDVDVGVDTSDLPLAEIEARVAAWSALGVEGLLPDNFGYDAGTSRVRQNAVVGSVHGQGLVAVVDAFDPADALDDLVDATFNPTGAPTALATGDVYFYSLHQIEDAAYVDEEFWRAKAEALDSLRQPLGVEVFSVTSTDVDDPSAYDEDAFFYSWYSAALHGHRATGWAEFEYSSEGASNGQAPFRARPSVDLGTVFTGPISVDTSVYSRSTDLGSLWVDAYARAYGFFPAPSIVSTTPAAACAGAPLVLSGSGYAGIATRNSVTIGGAAALVDFPSDADALVVTVPAGATSGDVTIDTGNGPAASFAFSLLPACPVALPGTIDLQTAEGTYPADLAVVSGASAPTLHVTIDRSIPVVRSVQVLLVGPAAGTLQDVSALFGLSDAQRAGSSSSVPLEPGTNVLLVQVNDEISFHARLTRILPGSVLVENGIDGELLEDGPVRAQSHTLLAVFADGTSDREIAEYLQAERLRPADLLRGSDELGTVRMATFDTLLRTSETGETTAGILAQLLADPPPFLVALDRNVRGEVDAPMPAAEWMPTRLRTNGYDAGTGGFDDSGSTSSPGTGGSYPDDELDFFWPHFLMQTFPAYALRDRLVGAATPAGLAVIDTGFAIPGSKVHEQWDGRIREAWCLEDGELKNGSAKRTPMRDWAGPLGMPPYWDGFQGHGTFVALLALADGDGKVVGSGRHAQGYLYKAAGKPFKPEGATEGKVEFDARAVRDAFVAAANNPDVDVISISLGVEDTGEWETQFRELLSIAEEKGVVYVNSAGNSNGVCGEAAYPLPKRLAAPRGERGSATNPRKLFVVVAATDITGTAEEGKVRGPETRWWSSAQYGSDHGPRVHVSAPGGKRIVRTRPIGSTDSGSGGTSWAAPIVAGLLAEMIQLSEGLEGVPADDAARRAHRLRLIEILEATADDLGTVNGAPDHANSNDDAGNGPDDVFGYGRVNAWKAFLSVANGGIATQHGRADLHGATPQDPPDGLADDFPQVALKDDAATAWYGFEIYTSSTGATVWIDGEKLVDAATLGVLPFAPEIRPYQGVRSDRRVERGVHMAGDGFADDDATESRPGEVVEEDPLTGILPVGTRVPGSGQRVIRFSIPRADLYDASPPGPPRPRTLSLRFDDAQHGVHSSYYSLRLETAKMRTGEVSGVTFDDFVFVITPTDYGDAHANPTLLGDNGARHQNTLLEWLGRLGGIQPFSVTPEVNADVGDTRGGDATVDVDGVVNRGAAPVDRDGRDDGLVFYPLMYKPGAAAAWLDLTIGVADVDDPRYAREADRSLFANVWIDWNTDGDWDDAGEHVVDGAQINPRGTAPPVGNGQRWEVVHEGPVPPPSPVLLEVGASARSATFRCTFPVPAGVGNGPLWARARLDYGENVGRNDPRPLFRSLPSLRAADLLEADPQPSGQGIGFSAGAARYGEVEDHLVGSDFGDAPDLPYRTKEARNGARHLSLHREWLGPLVSREAGADGEAETDELPNLDPSNTDARDDGVTFLGPLVKGATGTVRITVTTSASTLGIGTGPGYSIPRVVGVPDDAHDDLPRYQASLVERRLHVSGWADWNGDGDWEDAGEKIVDADVDPATFGENGAYTLGESFTDVNDNTVWDEGEPYVEQFGENTGDVTREFPVPETEQTAVWFRFRLSFGENDAANLAHPLADANEAMTRTYSESLGGALWGEVEDHLVPIQAASVCGDGNVDVGEACDDGNGQPGDCCFACTHEVAGSPCGTNLCIVGQTCNGAGSCGGGDAVLCNDGNGCTSDACNPSTGNCVFNPVGGSCNDGNACTANDSCSNGTCLGVPIPGCGTPTPPRYRGPALDRRGAILLVLLIAVAAWWSLRRRSSG